MLEVHVLVQAPEEQQVIPAGPGRPGLARDRQPGKERSAVDESLDLIKQALRSTDQNALDAVVRLKSQLQVVSG